ncbi:MAG: acyl--CoA ligase [Desulfobacterales bacterium]|nr:acyl--CoA ligase [Desulfobacterales bacterium]
MAHVVEGPQFPDNWFVHGKQTFAQTYAMAADIRRFLAGAVPSGAAVCLCAENKGIVAAALLATLDGRTPLVIPHSNASHSLQELHCLTGYAAAITDTDRQLPPEVAVFSPTPGKEVDGGWAPVTAAPTMEWLRLYTGGSTGTPQVWSKTVANIFMEATYLCRVYDIGPHDRIVATVTPNHIYGLLYSVMLPLIGSAAVIAGVPTFPQEIVSAVNENQATVLASVPIHYRILNGQSPFGKSLRLAFSSAGALAPKDGDAFYRQTATPVTEIYGSTETGGIAARCRAGEDRCFMPFDPIDWKIKEDRLCIRSAFISAQLPIDHEGFFTTPDHVGASGRGFVLKGRSDNVVKVGGKRVDMERIRESLVGLSGIRDAFVMSAPLTGGRENELIAVVEGDMDEGRLRGEMTRILEPCEMPRRILTVRRIPTTVAGKYDRKAVAGLFNISAT